METAPLGPSGESIDTPRHRALGSASRAAILRLVADAGPTAANGGLTAADVVERTALHPSTVQAHLDRLVAAGLLVRARASGGSPGRPAWRYRAAASAAVVPAPAPYRALAGALLEHLAGTGTGAAADAAGRAWGRRLAAGAEPAEPVATVVGVLRQLGFDPDRRPPGVDGQVEVHLHTCPFLELVGRQPSVMCALHAGLLRGALQAAGLPDAEALLEPFAAPTACVARLRIPAGATP